MSETKRQRADLQRHYSTIGIGDVFVEGLPPHPLPSVYLDPKQEGKQPSSFLSWEIVGDIKVSPEDFVVQEIALRGKTIPGWKEEQWGSVRVADLISWNSEAKKTIIQSENESKQKGESGKEQNRKSENTSMVVPSETPQDASRLSALVSDDILKQLKRLHEAAREELFSTQTQNEKNPPQSVTIHLDDKSSAGGSAAQDRGVLHQAIRNAFPLLLSETNSDNTTTASEESTTMATKQYRIDVTMDTRFAELTPYLHSPDVDLVGLYTFYKRGYVAAARGHKKQPDRVKNTYPSLTDPTCSVLRLRTDLPRNERKNVHEILSQGTNRLLVSFTTPDYPLHSEAGQKSQVPTTAAVIVRWCHSMEKRLSRKRKHGGSSASFKENDVVSSTHLFVLKKQGKEHLAAIRTIVEGLRCGQSDIDLAGIKDMNAITYQFCTVTGIAREKIQRAKNFFRNRDMEVGEPVEVGWRIEKGDLEGNRFQITLRNVQRVCVQGNAEKFVPLEVPHLKSMLERVSRSGFVNFYAEQRVGIPGDESIAGVRAFDIGRAMLQQDFGKAVDLLMRGRQFIRGNTTENRDILRFRETWKSSGGDPKKSWKALPRGNTLLRERAVLRGLKRYGLDKPLEAFRSLHRNERFFFVSAYQSYIWNLMATERLQRLGYGVVEGDLVLEGDDNVKYITENLSAWKIDDVVLPLPGSHVLFPTNAVGDLYKEILKRDEVLFSKDAPDESTARGSYRRLIAKAENIELKLNDTGEEKVVPAFTLSFDLSRGCYGTAFLRELMMTTIDRFSESAADEAEM